MVRITFRTNCHAASLERNYDIFVRSHSSCFPPPPILAWYIRVMLPKSVLIKNFKKFSIWDLFGYSWKLKIKTEKYYNKIIFKYMNSIVGPIFNEKVVKKWNLRVRKQWNLCWKCEKKSNFAITVYEQ